MRLSCKYVVLEAEEEGFEPSIPRLEVLWESRLPLFVVVRQPLYLRLILAGGVAPCSWLLVVGWCTNWCKSVYAGFAKATYFNSIRSI